MLNVPEFCNSVAGLIIAGDKFCQLLPHSQQLLCLVTDSGISPVLKGLPVLLGKLSVLCHQGLVGLHPGECCSNGNNEGQCERGCGSAIANQGLTGPASGISAA